MIRWGDRGDWEALKALDRHIGEEELKNVLDQRRLLVMYEDGELAGWMRYGLFWDNLPFMNMLYILEGRRGRGGGRQLVGFWEREMGSAGYDMVLTSTLSSEQAQFFYRRLGYQDCGALVLPGEALEILLMKRLRLRYRKADSIIESEDGLRPHGRIAD